MKLFFHLSFFLIILTGVATNAQTKSLRFKHVSYNEGLTNSNVYCFAQDNKGFMWIGTEGGLFRYDGLRFKEYKSYINDTASINSNVAFSILYDSYDNLWVGTYKGINLYNQEHDNFIDFNLSELYTSDFATTVNGIIEIPDYGVLLASSIGAILIDPVNYTINHEFNNRINGAIGTQTIINYHYNKNGLLWIGTEKGLFLYDLNKNEATFYSLSKISGITESNIIIDFHEDAYGDLWVSTRGGGLFRRKNNESTFKVYLHDKNNNFSISSNECYDFWENKEGELWISTNGGGLNLFHRSNNNFTSITNQLNDKYGLLNNNTRTIYQDRQGNIWISSFQAGVNILLNTPYQFNPNSFELAGDKGFESTSVISFNLDNNNTLWVGTDGGGLKRINRKTNEIISFAPSEDTRYTFPDKVVMNIFNSKDGKLWMGTYLEGLIEFDPITYNYKQYKHNPNDSTSISNNFITQIFKDTKDNFWIGTNGGGLNLFDRTKGEFKKYQSNYNNTKNSLVNNYINVIEEDFYGNLWIGTYWGLSRFNPTKKTFTNYNVQDNKINNLNSNIIYSILSDSKNQLWIGTRTGLAKFDFARNKFINLTGIEGLSSNQINGIIEDNYGYLWLSTDNGIVKFNPKNLEAFKFTEEDGLQGNEFYHNACYKSSNGEVFFGGYKGYNSFYPDSIKKRFYEPEVVLTNLRILDREVTIGEEKNGKVILKKNITLTDKLELQFSDKSITLGFSAVDFIEGNKNIYAYKLENFDKDWNFTNSEYPFATYTNLSPGKYILKVKAGKYEFIDQITKERQIAIIVKPPFWRTFVAYILYVVLIVFIIAYFWRLSIQRVKERNAIKLEKIKREQSEAISQARMQFFTNISHEIRTPLTLIIGPLEQLIAKGSEVQPYRRQFDIMLKNARRLLRLINQLLDLRKIELGKSGLRAEYANISKFVKDIVFSFEEHAQDKKIDFFFNSKPTEIKIWFDPDKMDKVVFNLLSNAFKYTPERGKINVNLTNGVKLNNDNEEYVELHVSDSGQGINKEDLGNIFNRFYQGKVKNIDSQQGWGLGLSLTDSFVKLHKGKIQVDSAIGAGSNFKIYLPNGQMHISDEDKVTNSSEPGLNKYIHLSTEPFLDTKKKDKLEAAEMMEHKPQLLIVEDNKELREYLLSELEATFNCFEASNGDLGMEMAVDIMPDLIISDIMMPGMNGVELCRSIKENIITSHIPVILLTAKSNVEDQIKGFESGADAYIPKPFNIENLIANTNSILLNRKRLREKLSSMDTIVGVKKTNSADDKFINLVDSKITESIADFQFGVEELAKQIGMSRAHLHRKMKAIANIGPNEYIRKIRLQKAAKLLLEGELTITEVSLEVGFNSTSYFSSTFKNHFKVSPKTFINKNSGQ